MYKNAENKTKNKWYNLHNYRNYMGYYYYYYSMVKSRSSPCSFIPCSISNDLMIPSKGAVIDISIFIALITANNSPENNIRVHNKYF